MRRSSYPEPSHCNACKRELTKDVWYPVDRNNVRTGEVISQYHWGELRGSFGYGSRLDRTDGLDSYDVCEECWEKALSHIGLDPNPPARQPTPEEEAENFKLLREIVKDLIVQTSPDPNFHMPEEKS